jgi:hypothetical protein
MKTDIYKNLPFFEKDLTDSWNGGGNHSIFEELILSAKDRIKTIIEVGTWKGQSAINMANILKKNNIKCKIYCVDTFLGGWKLEENDLKNGYPQIYYKFLNNIVHEKCEDYIIPCPNTSSFYYREFKKINLTADLIYIDGCHEYEEVYTDIKNYSDLLKPNGIIFGDDYSTIFPGVKKAIEKYCLENNKTFQIIEQRYWRINNNVAHWPPHKDNRK